MPNLAPYIAFPGNAKDAFEHYRDVFGGDLQLFTYADMPMEGAPSTLDPASVAHASLTLPGGTIVGGDAMPGEDYPIRGSAYSLMYSLEDPDEARRLIALLVDAGGSVGMPFEPAPWGAYYGQVFDRFGVMWAFDVDAEEPTQA
ncbi:VOC family protein [Propioniciclava coleopterorum]|uniref:VOC family protein n=1 Tax=Propioniciclava coleopterorum TaxID=2714937 RepID=A0A6G7Y5G5_9ACTN|nr:VOC family protein [Propioniciclava coleopterorum]QIK72050.1 VOC family protein [Propioniciclava coleopterorum]